MFSSEKVLQEICYLLKLNNNRMNLLKLMKELYLIDRRSIEERDSSVSGDVFFSMPHGPVLSQTLNNLNDIPNILWSEYLDKIEAAFYPDIQLKKEPEFDRLSAKDREFISEISERFFNYQPKQLEDYTHTLPEWVDPRGSSQKIRFYDIMKALGKEEDEIAFAKAEYDAFNELANADRL